MIFPLFFFLLVYNDCEFDTVPIGLESRIDYSMGTPARAEAGSSGVDFTPLKSIAFGFGFGFYCFFGHVAVLRSNLDSFVSIRRHLLVQGDVDANTY